MLLKRRKPHEKHFSLFVFIECLRLFLLKLLSSLLKVEIVRYFTAGYYEE